jgi:hypothetical protein
MTIGFGRMVMITILAKYCTQIFLESNHAFRFVKASVIKVPLFIRVDVRVVGDRGVQRSATRQHEPNR